MGKLGKPPAFQMYASDFYMDTQELNVCEVGAYTRLLMVQWVNGSLPKEVDRLANIAGMELETFKIAWPKFRKKFIDYGDGGSRLINIRLKKTRQELDELREKKRRGGTLGAEVRWTKEMKASTKLEALEAIEEEKTGSPTVVITGKKILEKIQQTYVEVEYKWPQPEFKEAWAAWVAYKKHTHKFKYKDPISETRAINLAYKQFNGNLAYVLEAIELSMGMQWKGIYANQELKQKYEPKKKKENIQAYGGTEEI